VSTSGSQRELRVLLLCVRLLVCNGVGAAADVNISLYAVGSVRLLGPAYRW
jgi:hypothetical protein